MVSYFTEDTKFAFKEKRLTNRWLKLVAESEIRAARLFHGHYHVRLL